MNTCHCAHPKPVTRHGVMGRGGVFCGYCGRDLEAERFVVKLEDMPPHVAHAADPYLPLSTPEGRDA